MRALVPSALLRCALRWMWLAFALALALAGAGAQAQGVQLDELKAQREGSAVLLTVRLTPALPEVAQDALRRGVPVYFEAEAEVLRRRRYWLRQRLARARRYMRLRYQPLTRHWVVSASARPFAEGTGSQSITSAFDTLDEALAAVGHMERWHVASAAQLAKSGQQTLRFRFRLDAKRLPRTMQIGAMGPGASGWTLAEQREISLGRASRRPAASAAAAAASQAASAPLPPDAGAHGEAASAPPPAEAAP